MRRAVTARRGGSEVLTAPAPTRSRVQGVLGAERRRGGWVGSRSPEAECVRLWQRAFPAVRRIGLPGRRPSGNLPDLGGTGPWHVTLPRSASPAASYREAAKAAADRGTHARPVVCTRRDGELLATLERRHLNLVASPAQLTTWEHDTSGVLAFEGAVRACLPGRFPVGISDTSDEHSRVVQLATLRLMDLVRLIARALVAEEENT